MRLLIQCHSTVNVDAETDRHVRGSAREVTRPTNFSRAHRDKFVGFLYRERQMSDSGNDSRRRDWRLIVVAVVALALVAGGIAYKYTGDFTGFAKFGTSGQTSRD